LTANHKPHQQGSEQASTKREHGNTPCQGHQRKDVSGQSKRSEGLKAFPSCIPEA
jgi:hypothetical protein